MAGGFKIAEAYVEIVSKIDEAEVRSEVRKVADTAQSELNKKKPSTSVDLINWKETSDLLEKMSTVPMALAKFSALGGVGALIARVAGSLVALTSSIGLASLSLSALIPAVVGIGGVFGVLMLIWKSADPAIKRLKDSLVELKNQLTAVAVTAALPGLQVFLKGALSLTPLVSEFVRRLAQGIGWLGAELGVLAQAPLFRLSLAKLFDTSATGANHLLSAISPLLDVIVMLGAAAGPTFVRFATWIDNLIRRWRDWMAVATETGRIQRILKESADEAAKLGKILWNFFSGLVGILHGAKGPAIEFSDSILKISESFKAWAWKPETQEKIAKFIDFLVHIDVAQFFKTAAAFLAVGKALEGFSKLADFGKEAGAVAELGPVGVVVVALSAAVALFAGALVAAYFASQKFRDAIGNAFGWVKDNVIPVLQEMWHWLAERFGPAVDQAVTNAIPGFTAALTNLQGVWNDNRDDIMDFVDKLKTLIGYMMDPGIHIIGSIAGVFAGAFATALGAALFAVGAFNVGINAVLAVIQFLWDVVQNVSTGLVAAWNWVWEAGAVAWNGLLAVIQFVVNMIVAGWNWLLGALQPVFDNINGQISLMGDTVRYLWDVIQPTLTLIGIAFDLMKFMIQSSVNLANIAIQWLWEKVQVAWSVIQNALSAIGAAWSWLASAISSVVGWISQRLSDLMNWFNSMRTSAESTTSGARDSWYSMWDTVASVAGWIRNIGATMWDGLRNGVSSAVEWVKGRINDLLGAVQSASNRINDVLNSIRGAVSRLNPLGWAHGGIVGAATGGVRGGVHLVGEHGPELVNLPAGSRVRSNPDSRRIAEENGGRGGSVAVQVSFGGNTSDAFASAFMLLVRQGKIQLTAARA